MRRPGPRRPAPRRVAVATMTVALTTGTAWAFWSAPTTPGSNGAAQAATVGQPARPTATAAGRDVSVSWPAATLSSGAAVSGYRVTRHAEGGPQPVGGSCADVVTTTTCTDPGVPEGTWTYTVTALVGDHWRGPDSQASAPVVVDVTGPAGGSVDATGLSAARYATTQALTIAFSAGTDGSGLAATGAELRRAQGSLGNGSCSGYGAFALVGTDPVSPKADAVPSGSACYRYRYVVRDPAGNTTTYESGDVKVDTSAPTAPTLTPGTLVNAATTTTAGATTVWYRPGSSGSFALTAASNDNGSGVASFSWPANGTGWSRTGGTGATASYSWNGTPDQPGPRQVTATNRAGLTSPATTFTVAADGTAPTGSTIDYPDGLTTADTVVVTMSTGTDGQSGVSARVLERAVAPLSGDACGPFGAFTPVPHGTDPRPTREDQVARGSCYAYRYVVSDGVGNKEHVTSPNVVRAVDSSYARAVRTTPGLAAYWRLGDSPQSRDSFDGTAGVPLQSRPSEDGTTWTRQPMLSLIDSVVTGQGRIRRTGAATPYTGSIYYSSVEPSRADYTVEADIYVASNMANDLAGVIGRWDPSGTATSYAAGYDQATRTWQLIRATYGQRVVLAASTPRTLTPGQSYRVALDMRGTRLRLILDGEPLLSATDDAISIGTAGIASGFGTAGTAEATTETTGMHLDSFRVTPPAADAVGANHGGFLGAPLLRVLGAIAGDVDTAASFDGVGDTATLPATAGPEQSLELWFKARPGSGRGAGWLDAAPVATADVPGADDVGIALSAGGNLVAGTGAGDDQVVSPGTYDDDAWHHAVVTRSESAATLRLFVDGALVGSAPVTGPLSTGATTLRLGRGVTTSTGFFRGVLDEVAWYDVALGEQSVAAHHLAAQ